MIHPRKRLLLLVILASLLGGVVLAAYEIYNLNRGIAAAEAIASSVAAGLGDGTVSNKKVTVSARLCFGLIPLGHVDHPHLVVAVGDLIIGTIMTGCLIFVAFALRRVARREPPLGGLNEPSRIA